MSRTSSSCDQRQPGGRSGPRPAPRRRPRPRRRRPRRRGRTRPESDGPTTAGARCTRAGCCASTRSRCSATAPARTGCGRPRPPRSPPRPGSWRRHTTGRTGTARSGVSVRWLCGTTWRIGSIFSISPQASRSSTHPLAGDEAIETAVGLGHLVVEPAVLVEDRDHLQIVAPADLEIVEVVGRRDLDRARALLRVGVGVGDDRQAPADQRQQRMAADQIGVARIVGMDRDRRCRRAWSRAGWWRP